MSKLWKLWPNARYIDALMEDRFTEFWSIGPDTAIVSPNELERVWDSLDNNEILFARWRSVTETHPVPRFSTFGDSILALLAFPDAGQLFHSEVSEVEMLAKLGSPAAILLYPACKKLKEVNYEF